MSKVYIPDRGDILKLNFNPQSGSEQSGFRPVLVISPLAYNQLSSLVIVCPIASKQKGLKFEVILPQGLQIYGMVLCDQIKSLAWLSRSAFFEQKVPLETLEEVLTKIATLVT